MTRWRSGAAGAVAAVLLSALPARAQTERYLISVNGGVQTGTTALSQSVSIDRNQEALTITASAPESAVPFFDASVTGLAGAGFGLKIGVSYLSDTSDVDVTAEVPHPFFFNQPRTVQGRATGVAHSETAVHLDAAYVIRSPTIDLELFGGASFMKVTQDIVTDVLYDETYPYDTATFVSATLERADASKVGYNAGADVTWKIGTRWGLGGVLRFTRVNVPLSSGSVDAGTADVGGVQAGGGLRLFF